MTNQITETGLAELLAAAKGDYVAVLNQVKEEAKAQDLAKAQRSTVAYRQQVWANAIAKLDRGLLARINKTMQTYLRVVKKNAPVTSAEGPRLLEAEEANGLMTEFLAMRDIEEFVKVRREDIRRAVFGHLTESFAGQGEDFPEHISGSLGCLSTTCGSAVRVPVVRIPTSTRMPSRSVPARNSSIRSPRPP